MKLKEITQKDLRGSIISFTDQIKSEERLLSFNDGRSFIAGAPVMSVGFWFANDQGQDEWHGVDLKEDSTKEDVAVLLERLASDIRDSEGVRNRGVRTGNEVNAGETPEILDFQERCKHRGNWIVFDGHQSPQSVTNLKLKSDFLRAIVGNMPSIERLKKLQELEALQAESTHKNFMANAREKGHYGTDSWWLWIYRHKERMENLIKSHKENMEAAVKFHDDLDRSNPEKWKDVTPTTSELLMQS